MGSHTNLHSPRLHKMWYERDCVPCDGAIPSCNCAADEQCVLTSRTCSQCPTIQCNKKGDAGGGGINPGVIAGPVVAVLIILSLALFWWLRRKKRLDLARLEELAARAKKAESAGFHLSQPGSPSPGSARSGPPSSARSGSGHRRSQLPLPPPSANPRRSSRSPIPKEDPFGDNQSVSTSGSKATSSNHIPIQYIPPSTSDKSIAQQGAMHGETPLSAAARLDEARQNLWKPKPTPIRPARSPGLDLRAPDAAGAHLHPERSPGGGIRDSYLSDNSAAPSFLSGMTGSDIYMDAPKIFTSKQVQIGRLQQAEVVQWGNQNQTPGRSMMDLLTRQQQTPSTPGGQSPGPSVRHLTPGNRRFDDTEEGMVSDEPSSAGSGDFRFSMGSLAYRDSMSSMGTSRYLATNPDGNTGTYPAVPPPRSPHRTQPTSPDGPRESMLSSRSFADSVLGAYPMIPPNAGPPVMPGSGIPQSSSSATILSMGNASAPMVSRPPPSFKPLGAGASSKQPPGSRPTTGVSVADSFLGTFPFVPPNLDDLAELPSAGIPTTANPYSNKHDQRSKAEEAGKEKEEDKKAAGRHTLGLSTFSEGLGGFEFRLDGEAPPVPSIAFGHDKA